MDENFTPQIYGIIIHRNIDNIYFLNLSKNIIQSKHQSSVTFL